MAKHKGKRRKYLWHVTKLMSLTYKDVFNIYIYKNILQINVGEIYQKKDMEGN